MSNLIPGNAPNLYDPATGALVGYVDANGKEQMLGILTAAQLAAGVTNMPGLAADGTLVDATGRPLPAPPVLMSAARVQGMGYWFPFTSQAGQDKLTDRRVNMVLTASGTAMTYQNVSPRVAFNASGFLQSDITVMTLLQRYTHNISTLTENDELLIWFDLTHPTTLGTACIFYVGRNSNMGFGVTLNGQPGKLIFDHVPNGGTRDQYTMNTSFALRGDNSANTRSAVAMTISRSGVDVHNQGNGGGLFEIELSKVGITDQGPFGQCNDVKATPMRIPNTGTAPFSYTDVGLTIGARPTTNASTVADVMPATYGINSFGALRRKRRVGHAQAVAMDLSYLIQQGQDQLLPPPAATL